jgi:phosphoglucosamine mutase
MRSEGYNLGGEQSGHIVMTDYATTGDGLLAGLQFLSAMAETGRSASELARNFETVPQMLENVRYAAGQDPLSAPNVQTAITAAEARLAGSGRLLIRKSGTEPLIRVMAECEDDAVLREVVLGLAKDIRAAAG